MNKDVVYIDVEDDITAIIGKVKESKEKIVALVPPKRIGVLQSAVNLRLLQRAASNADKRIVLITSNQALGALSAAAQIPVAKNLQSKPELAEIPVLDIDNGEDVIDGASLPVGEHAKAGAADTTDDIEVIEGINLDDPADTSSKKAAPVRPARKQAGKIPDFNKFRKKIFIGIAAGILLIGGLVWAFVFAPAATVIITARTTPVPVSGIVRLAAKTDAEDGTIKVATQTIQKDASVQFEATGQKDVGEKAKGTVRFSTGSIVNLGKTVPSGTELTTASGVVFVTTSPVTFTINNYTGVDASVVAAESGEKYNAASGAVSGAPAGVSASIVGATAGGTTKVVPIVTAADVQAAKEKLVSGSDDAVRAELKDKFPGSVKVIATSFSTNRADATSSPAIGEETTDKKATLTSKTTYSLSGIETSEIEAYITEVLKKQMQDQTAQKVYSTGVDTVALNDFSAQDNAASVRLVATGQVGPVIKEDEIKQKVAGKRFGDIQAELSSIDGVDDVQVKFSFFWVRTVPKDEKKITIKFDITDNANK